MQMRPFVFFAGAFFLSGMSPFAAAQNKANETTVCQIVANPLSYNNKMVRVRGRVVVNFENFYLADDHCKDGIWLAYADGSGPPGLEVYIPGRALPGENLGGGARSPPISVELVRDLNFEKFEECLRQNAKTESQSGRPCQTPCHLYRVTATFIGRLDGVAKAGTEIRHHSLKSSRGEKKGWIETAFFGFGQMGKFRAQLVVQSVADIEAIDVFSQRKPSEPH